MAGSAGENYEVEKSVIGFSSVQSSCQSNEDLAEWRLPEQVDNGTPSTSPSYWDTNDDNNYGPRPFELYTDFTWEIEEFKMISKRELRSEVFEVGNYKWHILIYPQGCDICNHLSLFLCVANHDKLLPGWSHFAQFTITVVNRDSKKSKYSDTLHRFWKKEHDWGWKKFMELSKVEDGFIVDDKLVIKAQVQVIRENAHRLFRCLDCGYRRELVRVYLPNVEQICWRFLNERRGKLGKLIEDKTKWSSFCAFWLGVDQKSRLQMSREKTEVVLKVLIKHFFIEKEVTSTLVMDSLFSGLKALECQSKRKKCREMLLETKDTQAPIVFVEKDMFFLADDVLSLLERAAREPLPPKDEKGPQNRMKDGSSGEDINNDSINCDERRLTELGRRTIEIFVLAHIFSNRIEVAYQEAVALKRQEELIREEEAAIRAANERKAKHIAAENLSKKKQAKQSRNSRKRKDKRRKEKSDVLVQGKHHQEKHIDERKLEELFEKQVAAELEMPEAPEDASELSDLEDVVTEKVQHDFEGRDASRVHWDTDILEIHHVTEAHSNGRADKRSPSVVDDSSSTCSTDSVPSMVTNGPYKRNSLSNCKKQTSPSREMNQRGKKTRDWGAIWSNEMNDHLSVDVGCVDDAYGNCRATEPNSEAISFLKDLGEEADLMQRKPSLKDQLNGDRPSKQPTSMETPSSPSSSSTSSSYNMEPKVESRVPTEPATGREILLDHPRELDQAVPIVTSLQIQGASKLEAQELEMVSKSMFIPIEKPVMDKIPVISRPLSAPIIPGTGLGASFISMVETAPTLSRSVSEVGRLGTNFSPATPSYIPHSYRNTTIGDGNGANPAGFTPHCSNSTLSLPSSYPQQPSSLAPRSGFTFGTVTPEKLQSSPHLMAECSQGGASSVIHEASLSNNICNLRLYGSGSIAVDELPARVPAAHASGILADEFPHLDLINYLLEEEHSNGKAAKSDTGLQRPNNGHPNILNRHFTFPDDVGMSANMGLLSADQPVSYHGNGIQRVYASSNGHFDELRDLVPQVGLLPPYSNGNIDGLMQDQFPVGDNLFFRDLRNREGYRCPYHMPDYSNLASRVRTYNVLHL